MDQYLNTKEHLGSTQTCKWISTNERDPVDSNCTNISTTFVVGIKKLPTLYWLPKLHKLPFQAFSIQNLCSCITFVLSKVMTSCLTAGKTGLNTIKRSMKETESSIFGQ